MKKVLLTAALGCAMIAPSFAQNAGGEGYSSDSHNGALTMDVHDYITLNPTNTFEAGPVVFHNPQQMVDGYTFGYETMTVVASRAWKFEYSASNFNRTGPGTAPTGVATSVPAGNIWFVSTKDGSSGVNTYNGTYIPASSSLQNLANQATGTTGSTFTLGAKLIPGLTNQMSGVYQTSIVQIASLN
jgi:hypothetical protein